MNWKTAVKERNKLVLTTVSAAGNPRAIVVISLGTIEGRILIGACLMGRSLENIKKNKKISIVTLQDKYYRINGFATIFSSGNYLDIAVKKSSPPLPKAALLIQIKEIVDLDTGLKVV